MGLAVPVCRATGESVGKDATSSRAVGVETRINEHGGTSGLCCRLVAARRCWLLLGAVLDELSAWQGCRFQRRIWCHVGIEGIQRVLGISWNALCARQRDMTWNSGSQACLSVCLSGFGGLTSLLTLLKCCFTHFLLPTRRRKSR